MREKLLVKLSIRQNIDPDLLKLLLRIEKRGGFIAGSFAAWMASPPEWDAPEPADIDIFSKNTFSYNNISFLLSAIERKEKRLRISDSLPELQKHYKDHDIFVQTFKINDSPYGIQTVERIGDPTDVLNTFIFTVSKVYLDLTNNCAFAIPEWPDHQKKKILSYNHLLKTYYFYYYIKYLYKGYVPQTANEILSFCMGSKELIERTYVKKERDVVKQSLEQVYRLLENTSFPEKQELKTIMSLI